MDFKEFLSYFIQIGKFKLTVGDLLAALMVLLAAKALVWFTRHVLLVRYFKTKNIDEGRQFALKQFLGYIIWVLAVFTMLEMLNISSMLWASSAALLVGIGLGLQDTFKDLIAGIVLLTEGSVEVGDILEVDKTPTRVSKIGLRTSKVETADGISILIPNSRLVVEKVTNWSHNDAPTRFSVKVPVNYSTDLALVEKLLVQAAEGHELVLQQPKPSVQFNSFGNPAIEVELLFYSEAFFKIDAVKSEIRLRIKQLFLENGVKFPFGEE